jgi:hypothetical protein
MDKARTLALAKPGAAQDPAYSEGETFAATAEGSLKARQFTAATQTFLQARDAYDRARRVIEGKEREAARAARAPTTTAAQPRAASSAAPLPTIALRPLPGETVAPAPTVAQVQTPPPAPTVVAPVPETREFVTARTRITAAPGAKKATGFEVELTDFSGKFEFEVAPNPLIPGAPFRVRIFLKNDAKNDAKLDSLAVRITRNGDVSNPQVRISEDNVKVGQRPMVAEIPGAWVAGTTAWVMDIEAVSKKGERFRSSLTMKQP